MHIQLHDMAAQEMTWHDIHYIHDRHTYMTYNTYMTDSTYMTYRTYMTYITDITDTLHFLRFQSMTRHDMAWLYFTSWLMAAARMGRGRGQRRKKKQSCAHSCCQRSLTPIQAHALPSACRAESCLLCCQPEPSLSRYLPDYHELLHDSLADCKLKGNELST